MDSDPIPEQPPGRRRQAAIFTAVTLAFGLVSVGFVMTLSGHQASNVFSNISNGLSGGGGLSAGSSDGSVGYTAPQAPAPAQPTAAANMASLVIGNPPPLVERDVKAAYTIPPGSFQKSFNEVAAETDSMGGYVASSTTTHNAKGVVDSGTVVVKIPSAKLSELLTDLPSTFVESTLDFTTVDHTAESVSASTNLALAQNQMAALQRALAATNEPSQISTISSQIDSLQAQIQSLQGTINVIQSEVTMSTASISLTERGVVIPPKPKPAPRIVQAASAGWGNDITLGADALYLVLSALPLLLLAGLLFTQRRRLLAWVGIGSLRRTPSSAEPTAS